MDVKCNWPGSVPYSDAKVFENPCICKRLRILHIFYLKKFVYQERSKNPYQIGDSAYPLLPYCMGEYSTYKSNEEVVFNSMLQRAGNPIKWDFGRLQARWQLE